jgi:rhodanese-related sulfurtransferase
MKTITRDTLKDLLDRGAPLTLLEALPERYYSQGHLPGAQHFPHTEVAALAPALLPDKTRQLVVYCASEACRNSHTAAALLLGLGYQDVAVYTGGKEDWAAAGFSLHVAFATDAELASLVRPEAPFDARG